MAIDRAEAARIAALARIALAPEDEERVALQLSQVLDLVATLDELDLAGCEPTVLTPETSDLRADEPDGRTLESEVALAGSPETEHGYLLVPPVVESLEP